MLQSVSKGAPSSNTRMSGSIILRLGVAQLKKHAIDTIICSGGASLPLGPSHKAPCTPRHPTCITTTKPMEHTCELLPQTLPHVGASPAASSCMTVLPVNPATQVISAASQGGRLRRRRCDGMERAAHHHCHGHRHRRVGFLAGMKLTGDHTISQTFTVTHTHRITLYEMDRTFVPASNRPNSTVS